MITFHVYPRRRAVVVRAAGELSAADWRRGLDKVRSDPEFDAEYNMAIVGMDRIALHRAAELTAALSPLWASRQSVGQYAFVSPDRSAHLAIERALLKIRAGRHMTVRCFVSEAAALAWIGWRLEDNPNVEASDSSVSDRSV